MIIPSFRVFTRELVRISVNTNQIRRNIHQTPFLCNSASDGVTDSSSKSKSRSHRPKTLQDLMDESKVKEAKQMDTAKLQLEQISSSPNSQPTEKSKALDIVNTGPKVPKNWRNLNLPEWKRQRFALLEKFSGASWSPKKKLSREEMNSVKILKNKLPDLTNTDLSQHFKISPEAIRRILRSKWIPTEAEEDDIHERWKSRGTKVKQILKTRNNINFKAPKVIINSSKQYTKVRYHKDGKKSGDSFDNGRGDGKKSDGAKSLRRMKF